MFRLMTLSKSCLSIMEWSNRKTVESIFVELVWLHWKQFIHRVLMEWYQSAIVILISQLQLRIYYLEHNEWEPWLDSMDTVRREIINAFYIGSDMNLMLIDNVGLYFMRFGWLFISFMNSLVEMWCDFNANWENRVSLLCPNCILFDLVGFNH